MFESLDLMGLDSVTINGSGVKLHFLGKKIRDDSVDVTFVVWGSFPIVTETIKDDVLIGLPFLEDKRAATDGPAVEVALAHGEVLGVQASAEGLFLQSAVVQKMLRENAHGPGAYSRRVKALVDDAHRHGVNDVDLLDRFVVRDARREVLRVHDGFVGELHVSGLEDMSIMEFHIRSQPEKNDGVVFHGRKDFRSPRLQDGFGEFRFFSRIGREKSFRRKAFEIAFAQNLGQTVE
jgi:hypothetical protein